MNYIEWNFIFSIVILSLIFLFLLTKLLLFIKKNWIKSIYLSFKNNTNKYILQEIGRALEKLSSKKIGASIIFEKNSNVNSFLISKGIKMNSIISSDLIVTIFAYKKNQLHDGAMIIDSDFKIKSVGNILPIAFAKPLGNNYGSRHKSVYTLVSMTKALGIVVSETSGFISCFIKKKLFFKTKDVSLVLNWLKKNL